MGIQDDIYDLEDFLENADAAEKDRFERIILYLGNIERDLEQYRKFYANMLELRNTIKQIDKE